MTETYEVRSDNLAKTASIMVQVLLGTAPGDMEFVPQHPQVATPEMWQNIMATWHQRGSRHVGFIGLVNMVPTAVFNEPLDPRTTAGLAVAFGVFVGTLVTSAYAEIAEVKELERIYAYSDPSCLPN